MNHRWGEWIPSALSTLNTMTEVPLSKAPNHQLLPRCCSINGCPLLRVCSRCVCVHCCVCALWMGKCRAQIPSVGHHTWPYVKSLSLSHSITKSVFCICETYFMLLFIFLFCAYELVFVTIYIFWCMWIGFLTCELGYACVHRVFCVNYKWVYSASIEHSQWWLCRQTINALNFMRAALFLNIKHGSLKMPRSGLIVKLW